MADRTRPEPTHVARPRFSRGDAARLAAELFGVDGTATELPSERDRNFRVDAGGRAYVLKIARAGEAAEDLELQNRALKAAAPTGLAPSVVRSSAGSDLARATGVDGREHLARLLTWVDGAPMAEVRPHSPALLADLGRALGTLDVLLAGIAHPAGERDLVWDLRRGADAVRERLGDVPDDGRRARLERVLARADAARPAWDATLRTSLVHNDANDHNVLVAEAPGEQRVVGLVDFGDMARTWTLAEPAIACAYAMLGKRDPLAAAAHVLRGYHAACPVPEDELPALLDLVRLRLATSVAVSARQARLEPANAYLAVSEAPAWALLAALEDVTDGLALAVFRDACGREPAPAAGAVRAWLAARADELAPVLGFELGPDTAAPLDLSVGSADVDELDARGVEGAWHERLPARRRALGVRALVGGYGEARLLYAQEHFARAAEDRDEPRTVHLGVDLFADAGTHVRAPLDGVVESVADNAGDGDYGPTVVLRHAPADGPVFWSLYGHLDPAVLDALAPGDAVPRGARFARLGAPPRNGGWPPHLHLQLVVDRLGHAGDYPGVAPPGQRRVWTSLCPDAGLLLGAGAPRSAAPPDPDAIRAARARHLSAALSTSYRRPLAIVRGRGARLFDGEGRAYLDAVNNVPHVGHAHPRVVAAERRQAGVLNTNTRYLHPELARYVERLAALCPDPLEVVFLVNSGSEANELALRLARAHTGARDVVAVEAGYHGNTTALVELSHYKLAGAGGGAPPEHAHFAPLPDTYRGRHRGPDAGARYGEDVGALVDAIAAAGRRPAAFLHETLSGCGGQIDPPDGWLPAAYARVRAAGGVCIADEVQTGFGRVGTSFWAFETQGVVPDLVTLGKPIGNGHPLGAVVTTRAVAASLETGMEWFNTFGGNPVSCAVGNAVLDVIADEGLVENARVTGAQLRAGLRALQAEFPLVGDVRGRGLFVGVELVLDRDARTPAPDHAAHVVERLRDRGVLVSTDGPDHDVVKIKPPMVFGPPDADRLCAELRAVLAETALAVRDTRSR